MNKFTDEYFKDKASRVFDSFNLQADVEYRKECIKKIYIALKEVARDVRHACAEVRVQDYPFGTFSGGGLDDETEARMQGFDEGQDAHAKACMNL